MGKEIFSSVRGDTRLGWRRTTAGSFWEVSLQSRGVGKVGRMLWALWDCTAGNFSRDIFCTPEKAHDRDRGRVNPAASTSPGPGNPRNSWFYFR